MQNATRQGPLTPVPERALGEHVALESAARGTRSTRTAVGGTPASAEGPQRPEHPAVGGPDGLQPEVLGTLSGCPRPAARGGAGGPRPSLRRGPDPAAGTARGGGGGLADHTRTPPGTKPLAVTGTAPPLPERRALRIALVAGAVTLVLAVSSAVLVTVRIMNNNTAKQPYGPDPIVGTARRADGRVAVPPADWNGSTATGTRATAVPSRRIWPSATPGPMSPRRSVCCAGRASRRAASTGSSAR